MSRNDQDKTKEYRDGEAIEKRFNRCKDHPNERYAAMEDYRDNLQKQKDALADMKDKNSPEYQQRKGEIAEQESKYKEMWNEAQKSYGENRQQEKVNQVDRLRAENRELSSKMEKAAEKGNKSQYDSLRQKYETNLKAQEGVCRDLREDRVEHRDTTSQQRSAMVDSDRHMAEKVRRDSKDKNDKYKNQAQASQKEAMKKQDDKALDEKRMTYGISEEEINAERRTREHERNEHCR
ncbi:MAG: hypothetical protein IKJ35_05505 [Clostridia bacterium]|nr:hypothetical protein [Clostridia bacterium]